MTQAYNTKKALRDTELEYWKGLVAKADLSALGNTVESRKIRFSASAVGAALFNITAIPAVYGAFTTGQGLPALALVNLLAAMGLMCYDAYVKGDNKTAFAHGFGIACNAAILWRLYIFA